MFACACTRAQSLLRVPDLSLLPPGAGGVLKVYSGALEAFRSRA